MIYFFLYLFLEVMVSVQVGSVLGGIGTFLEIMASGLLGVALLLNVKTTMIESFKAMSNNCINMKQFQELNVFALLGAIFLILPGILSDTIGVLMQFSVFTGLIMTRYSKKNGDCNEQQEMFNQNNPHKGDDNVIDVEVINNDNRLK